MEWRALHLTIAQAPSPLFWLYFACLRKDKQADKGIISFSSYSRFLVSTPRRLVGAGSPAVAPTKSMAEARTREENQSFILGWRVGSGMLWLCVGVRVGRSSVWVTCRMVEKGEGLDWVAQLEWHAA